ncbi:MAG: deoxyribose-phosphate aldolase [Cyanobacteriota bacterium]|nr:deoxyribose-phosphate aldolase [Cyanobacteriota bacterium]MDY6383061.1 deoxyribose-phosphate aldolase [Cyanobacteriota bacterium]
MEKLNKYIEHTLLKQDASKADLLRIFDEAKKYDFLGVCINPCYVKLAKENLKDANVKVVTVIGFPLGANKTETKVFETKEAVKDGADEIDMVINVTKLKDDEKDFVVNEIKEIKSACNGHNLKVIIETDLLTKDEIVRACKYAIEGGADFVKTSTGFVKGGVGAKAEDVKLMYDTVKDAGLKVKASGGIRDKEAALAMINAGASRLGTSSGVKIVS